MTEEWRDVIGYEGVYEVSSHGRVRSLDREIISRGQRGPRTLRYKGKIISQADVKTDDYLAVSLYRNCAVKCVRVHRLVCAAFHGPCPEDMTCAHLDGDGRNNHYANLIWCSVKENIAHKKLHGTYSVGEKHHSSVLTEPQVVEIRQRRSKGETYSSIANDYGVQYQTIAKITSGSSWAHVKEGLP